MEKLQTLCAKIDAEKEEITRLTKLILSDSGKGGELEPNMETALEEKEYLPVELKKV